jgi:hypothetical protein
MACICVMVWVSLGGCAVMYGKKAQGAEVKTASATTKEPLTESLLERVVAADMHTIGLAQAGEVVNARVQLEATLAQAKHQAGTHSIAVAVTLQAMATLYTGQGRYTEARTCLLEALAIYSHAMRKEYGGITPRVYHRLGDVSLALHDMKAAHQYYTEADKQYTAVEGMPLSEEERAAYAHLHAGTRYGMQRTQ